MKKLRVISSVKALRHGLLDTPTFKQWDNHPQYFKLVEVEPNTYDLHIKVLPGTTIKITPRELSVDVPRLVPQIKRCYINSGGPTGGTIRIQT